MGEACHFYSELGGLIRTDWQFMKIIVIFKLKELHFMMKQFRPTALLFETYEQVRYTNISNFQTI